MKTSDSIKLCDMAIYPGRNIYSHRSVMKMTVDIGQYSETPTKDIPGFNDLLLSSFPGLKTNCCGLGYEGGFYDRLKSGTFLAHVLEHVILEMQYMLGYDVRYGKTRLLKSPSTYYLIYEYQNEVCGLECGKAAIFILNCFLKGEEVKTGDFLDYLKKVSLEVDLGPSTSAIVGEAQKRGLAITRIGNESLVRLGYGKHSRLISATLTDATSCISADISCNKQLTKSILAEHNIPVPYGKVVYSRFSAVTAAKQIGFPVVLKPFDGNQGKGVFLNLQNEDEVSSAFKEASEYSNGIIVEQYVKGNDFRVLIVDGKVSAVAKRLPAMVIGDGIHTIAELTNIINSEENRGENHEKPLTKIKLDQVAISLLEHCGMTPDTIPPKGEEVHLRSNGNLSTGGTAIDCTDIIHPENAKLASLAAKAIGIDVAGIDIVTDDISKSILDTGGVIVEVNAAPGIRMHIYPGEGKARNVAADIVDYLFPTPASYKFPIISVTGTNGKTTTVRLISHVLSQDSNTVGYTTTSGTYIGDRCISRGDNSGPRSARALLSDKSIDCAVLETARGGIIRGGLGYEAADVGMVLNIAEDHLGTDDINTLEDLAFVKSLVTEAVKPGGFAVFNAEDEKTPYLMKRTHANKILFAKSTSAFPLPDGEDYVKVYTENNFIYINDNGNIKKIINISDIPITFGGVAECNVENALGAVCALYAVGVPLGAIERGLKTFEKNEGRFSIYNHLDHKIMLDYGHNLHGISNVIKMCNGIGHSRLIGVIGMPGDRSDDAIRSVGKLCSESFNNIYIKEDKDRRGRDEHEVADLFYREILDNRFDKENVKIITDECEALKTAIENAQKDDLIVVFYEDLPPLQKYLDTINATEQRFH